MKIAITHDYLMVFGGAERVLVALHEIYPSAPIYVSIYRPKKLGEFGKLFADANIIQSWFGYLPFADKLISPFRFLLPFIWGSFNLSKYDVIIDSSSWAITRGFKRHKNQIEICYCHTPPRYLYGYDTSRNWKSLWFGKLISLYSLLVNHFMRIYDWNSAQKVDYFIANSKNVAARIQKYYRRDSTIIYPPVEIPKAPPASDIQNTTYYLTGGRLVAAKNFDLIIKACIKQNVHLKIFGTGILEADLRKISTKQIEFLGKVSDKELPNLYAHTKAFVVAQKDEDFGITTLEAQSLGCPVIAYRGGGYTETIVENKTGIFFDDLTIDSISKAITKFKKLKFTKKDLFKNAQRFSTERFQEEFKNFILKLTP